MITHLTVKLIREYDETALIDQLLVLTAIDSDGSMLGNHSSNRDLEYLALWNPARQDLAFGQRYAMIAGIRCEAVL